MVGFWGGVIFYPVLQTIAIKGTRGRWKKIAYIPLVLMVFVLGITILGLIQGSNLWPIVFIFYSPVAIVFLILFLAIHALANREIIGSD